MIYLSGVSLTLVDYIFGKDKLVIVASDSRLNCRNSILYLADATMSLLKSLFHLSHLRLIFFND